MEFNTVDSVIKNLTTAVNKLESLQVTLTNKSKASEEKAAILLFNADNFSKEANRAKTIANNINKLLTV